MSRRQPKLVESMLDAVERREPELAVKLGQDSKDFVARTLASALEHRAEKSIASALLRGAERELARYNRGLSVLDTIITLAPLLGLLGTVTGMMGSFGMLGGGELGAPTAITGGIAEALIATAFGLGVAITALIPFNYLNARWRVRGASCRTLRRISKSMRLNSQNHDHHSFTTREPSGAH